MTTHTKQPTEKYDSNPFTLSFKGFSQFVDYAQGVFIATIILSILGFIFNMAGNLISAVVDSNSSSYDYDTTTSASSLSNDETTLSIVLVIIAIVLIATIVFLALSIVINAVYKGFVAAGTVAAAEKRKISVGQAFSEMGSRFGVLVFAMVITWAKIVGGYLLFIVPGIRAQLRYQPLVYVIMSDKKLSATQAVDKTKSLYDKHLMEILGISTVGSLIPLIGPSLTASGLSLSVKQITEHKAAGKQMPKAHILNYIGLILAGALVIFVIFIAGLIAILAANS
ncbi:MAG: hypothetical protein ACI9T8_000366 [Candidatus Saccharimonadales bacterium]|jgi:hypothetical protein